MYVHVHVPDFLANIYFFIQVSVWIHTYVHNILIYLTVHIANFA